MIEIPRKAMVDCSTGRTEILILSADEIESQRVRDEFFIQSQAIQEAEELAKSETRALALAKLAALGLTEDEINAITGA